MTIPNKHQRAGRREGLGNPHGAVCAVHSIAAHELAADDQSQDRRVRCPAGMHTRCLFVAYRVGRLARCSTHTSFQFAPGLLSPGEHMRGRLLPRTPRKRPIDPIMHRGTVGRAIHSNSQIDHFPCRDADLHERHFNRLSSAAGFDVQHHDREEFSVAQNQPPVGAKSV